MTIYATFVLIGKIIAGIAFSLLMIWLFWQREKSRYERDLKGYSPTLDLDKNDSSSTDGGSQRKGGIVVEFRKEVHHQPINEDGQFRKQKPKVRFSFKVTRDKDDNLN